LTVMLLDRVWKGETEIGTGLRTTSQLNLSTKFRSTKRSQLLLIKQSRQLREEQNESIKDFLSKKNK
jgi:hypothetical protein